MTLENYKKYRWFYTSNNLLVVGGKSAKQNDELLKKLKSQKEDLIVMHTSSPGSPFSIILSPINKVKPSDLEQAATFTACFSQAWKQKKKKEEIHIFKISQLSKSSKMKTGTWSVKQPIQKKSVKLELVLTKQKNKLRAVPEKSAKLILLKLKPGKIDKTLTAIKLQTQLKDSFSQEEILSALPAGGISTSQ